MNISFHRTYRPLTALPFGQSIFHAETNPSPELAPYVRCFWGSCESFNPHLSPLHKNRLLNADSCADLIFVQNRLTGKIYFLFTGLDDSWSTDTWDEANVLVSTFAIRFPFWSFAFFQELLEEKAEQLACELFERDTFSERIRLSEEYVRSCLNRGRFYHGDKLFPYLNSVDLILKREGRLTLSDLSIHTGAGHRQLQRLFKGLTDLSPKKVMNLVRYQLLWQAMAQNPTLNMTDAALRFGYTDQSHMIAQFKQHHGLTPKEAISLSHFSYTDPVPFGYTDRQKRGW